MNTEGARDIMIPYQDLPLFRASNTHHVSDHTPQSRRASATGIVLSFAWMGHALGGWQGGLSFDLTGAYFWAFANATLFGLVNLAVIGAIYLAVNRKHLSAV